MKDIDKIRNLVPELPLRDRGIALNFIAIRDFDELQSLVDSAIVRTNINVISDNPKEEYMVVNVKKLQELSTIVSEYRDQLITSVDDIVEDEIEELMDDE